MLYGMFNPTDGYFSCFRKGPTMFAHEVKCPGASAPRKVVESGVLTYRKMVHINPRDCVRLTRKIADDTNGTFFDIFSKVLKEKRKDDKEFCFKLYIGDFDVFEIECPTDEMRNAMIPLQNFVFTVVGATGAKESKFVAPTWDQYMELKKMNHRALEKDYYEYEGHDYSNFEYTEDDIFPM